MDNYFDLLEIKSESIYNKITESELDYYTREARRIGLEQAKNYKNINIIKTKLKSKNIPIVYEEKKFDKLDFKSEIIYEKKKIEIIIYLDSVEKIKNACNDFGMNISFDQLKDIHLAHEFFHFTEYEQDNIVSDILKSKEMDILKIFKTKRKILATREIAANAFAQSILGLEFHPRLLDYIYLVQNNKISPEVEKRILEEYANYKL